MKLWITGAKGLVARALIHLCQDRGIEYVATSHEQVDISQLPHVKKFIHSREGASITHIINCAAFTEVDRAETEKDLAFQANAIGPENLGLAAQELNAKLIHISTDYVFAGDKEKPYLETDSAKPLSVYGQTKWEGEKRLLDVLPSACILRTSWVFGPGGKNFISSILGRMKTDASLKVVSDQINRLTLAQDLAETILSLLCHSGIYHFANSGAISRFTIAQKIFNWAKDHHIPLVCEEIIPVPASTFPTPAKRPLRSVLSTDKITTSLGISPRSWDLALEEHLKHEI
ncbi:MAG: dTDP-4-dehydrorhamnose reductase [Verrucomicrobia bacterium]|nr:dTDP-4-dehydrorhamnose reductase [Verrucomicrobiota bacterium]